MRGARRASSQIDRIRGKKEKKKKEKKLKKKDVEPQMGINKYQALAQRPIW
jgi:hypothetical protein